MLLSGALFALFMTGFWLYCLTDAILTPASEFLGMSKPAWIAVITVTFVGGAIAWLIVRRPQRSSSAPLAPMPGWDPDQLEESGEDYFRADRWTDADDAVARHPAGRARVADTGRAGPKGPDDDPEFLRALDRAIHGNSRPGEEVLVGIFRSPPEG
jgi:Phospholipase_D-nuclease N-terminal